MLYALDSNSERRPPRAKKERATCPACRQEVLSKFGTIVEPHWAHKARKDCDPWSEHEGPWHLGWKAGIDPNRCEVVIGPHRADIQGRNGVVVELQHSPISPEVIAEREAFYRHMIWVVDAEKFNSPPKINLNMVIDEWDDLPEPHVIPLTSPLKNYVFPLIERRWYRPSRSWLTATKPVFFDFGVKESHLYRLEKSEQRKEGTFVFLRQIPKPVFFYKYIAPHGLGNLNQASVEHTRLHITSLLAVRSEDRGNRRDTHRSRMAQLHFNMRLFEPAVREAERKPPLDRTFADRALLQEDFDFHARQVLEQQNATGLNNAYSDALTQHSWACDHPRWREFVLKQGKPLLEEKGPRILRNAQRRDRNLMHVGALVVKARESAPFNTPLDKFIAREGGQWLEQEGVSSYVECQDIETLYHRVRSSWRYSKRRYYHRTLIPGSLIERCSNPAWNYLTDLMLPLLLERIRRFKSPTLPPLSEIYELLDRARDEGQIICIASTRQLSELEAQVALETAIVDDPRFPCRYGRQPLWWTPAALYQSLGLGGPCCRKAPNGCFLNQNPSTLTSLDSTPLVKPDFDDEIDLDDYDDGSAEDNTNLEAGSGDELDDLLARA